MSYNDWTNNALGIYAINLQIADLELGKFCNWWPYVIPVFYLCGIL